MKLVLFVATLLMTVVAMGFAAKPLVVAYDRRSTGSAKLSLIAIVVVFAMGVVLYGVVGNPEFSDAQATTQSPQPSQKSDKVGSVTSLLAGLEARLADNPDDAKGWLLLAKSYDHLGRQTEATDAYARAAALGMTDADFEGRLKAASGSADSTAAEIRGRVSVAESVTDRVEPGDTVYVIAKTNANPVPLAVLRRSASELPFDFVLNDQNSMVQGGSISGAGSVTVSARLSKPGDELNKPAKLGASSSAVDPSNAGELALVIDVVPGS